MIIEWGWDKYISDSEDEPYQQVGNTIIEKHWFEGYNTENFSSINSYINKYKQIYEGNYDVIAGSCNTQSAWIVMVVLLVMVIAF